jgi:hypothetical protein
MPAKTDLLHSSILRFATQAMGPLRSPAQNSQKSKGRKSGGLL